MGSALRRRKRKHARLMPPLFARDTGCTLCPLHEGCQSVCIPMRMSALDNFGASNPSTKAETALLIVGEAPGNEEDRVDQSFVGPSGQILHRVYIEAFSLTEHADVFLANAVRCRPPMNDSPKAKPRTMCRPYLLADIAALKARYPRIILLCTGATACQSVLGTNLTASLRHQGCPFPDDPTIPVFSTFHPAYLLPGRNPSALTSVEDHMALLTRFLETGKLGDFPDMPPVERAILPPASIREVWLDIETYGAVATCPPQTEFHPAKSLAVDRVAPHALVQTVALSWCEGDAWRCSLFVWQNDRERGKLRDWLIKFAGGRHQQHNTLGGMNILFDVSYLRAADPLLRRSLTPDGSTYLLDLSITNYLHSELRPERSLKALAPLFAVTRYERDLAQTRYTDANDPKLHEYNCRDAWATGVLHHYFLDRIAEDYPDSDLGKLSPYTRKWYSDLLWSTLHMLESGVAYSHTRLTKLRRKLTRRMKKLSARSPFPLSGPGSIKAVDTLIEELLPSLPEDAAAELALTKVEGKVSTGKQNLNALKRLLPSSHPRYKDFTRVLKYRQAAKIESSYLKPRLSATRSRLIPVEHGADALLAYPSWYVVPSALRDSGADEGGVIQARIVCRRPALQTDPPSVKKCMTTRWQRGVVLAADLSQIELRVPALLSGDPVMMDEYARGADKHAETAIRVFGEKIVEQPDFVETWRQAAKVLNFLTLYRGGAQKFHDTLLANLGLDLPIEKCYSAINSFWSIYKVLRSWQDSLIRTAAETGYLSLPLTGQSRAFLGGRDAVEAAINEVVNFPVQGTAANVLISAQVSLLRALRKHNLRATIGLQVYDAIYVDCPIPEVPQVRKLMDKHLTNPPYWTELCRHLGRTLPLSYEIKELTK